MNVASWYNLTAKRHEAIEAGRGRPVNQNVKADVRDKSKRVFGVGKTKAEALADLSTKRGVPQDEFIDVTKTTNVFYKGERTHKYVRNES